MGFQRRRKSWSLPSQGLGCNSGTHSHAQHVANLLKRSYGTDRLPGVGKSPPAHCNAVTDLDLFILSGLMLFLDGQKSASGFAEVSSMHLTAMMLHLKNGLKLFEQRTKKTSVTSFTGETVEGMVFDPGI